MENSGTIEERQEKDKTALLEALKEMPIVQIACKKVAISRATYYRWRKEDKEFLRRSEDCLNQGIEFINDMSESQLITLIKEKKMPAISMWLKHNNTRYGAKIRVAIHKPEIELSDQQKKIIERALKIGVPKKIKP